MISKNIYWWRDATLCTFRCIGCISKLIVHFYNCILVNEMALSDYIGLGLTLYKMTEKWQEKKNCSHFQSSCTVARIFIGIDTIAICWITCLFVAIVLVTITHLTVHLKRFVQIQSMLEIIRLHLPLRYFLPILWGQSSLQLQLHETYLHIHEYSQLFHQLFK